MWGRQGGPRRANSENGDRKQGSPWAIAGPKKKSRPGPPTQGVLVGEGNSRKNSAQRSSSGSVLVVVDHLSIAPRVGALLVRRSKKWKRPVPQGSELGTADVRVDAPRDMYAQKSHPRPCDQGAPPSHALHGALRPRVRAAGMDEWPKLARAGRGSPTKPRWRSIGPERVNHTHTSGSSAPSQQERLPGRPRRTEHHDPARANARCLRSLGTCPRGNGVLTPTRRWRAATSLRAHTFVAGSGKSPGRTPPNRGALRTRGAATCAAACSGHVKVEPERRSGERA